MKTTPTGENWRIYKDCTKGELYWCALCLYQLQKGEDAPLSSLKDFIKEEAQKWLK